MLEVLQLNVNGRHHVVIRAARLQDTSNDMGGRKLGLIWQCKRFVGVSRIGEIPFSQVA